MSLPRHIFGSSGGHWLHVRNAEPKPTVDVGVLACGFSGAGPAEAGGAEIAAQVRDMLCFFKLRSGAEETNSGKLLSVSLGEHNETLLWLVKAPFTETAPAPGLLQQRFAPDAKPPQDQAPTLVGEANAAVILQGTPTLEQLYSPVSNLDDNSLDFCRKSFY